MKRFKKPAIVLAIASAVSILAKSQFPEFSVQIDSAIAFVLQSVGV